MFVYKGKTYTHKVIKKDGFWVVDGKEYERVRKEMHPSLWQRMKNLVNGQTETDLTKGKLL